MDSSMFRGLGVAMVTPFNEDETIDFDSLEKLTNHICSGGADYLVVLGTTGETPTLTKKEQVQVFKFIRRVNAGRLPIMLGLGGNCTRAVVEQIAETDFQGVSAILSVAPYYNKPVQEGLYRHFMAIAEVAPVPIMLYNIPGRTGMNMTAETTLRLANASKKFIGIKEASTDLAQMSTILKGRPDNFVVVSGDDGLTLPLISMGGEGVISVIGNAFPVTFGEVIHQALEGNAEFASDLYNDVDKFVKHLFVDGNPAGIKALLNQMGIIKNYLRLPLVKATDTTYGVLGDLLSKTSIKS